MRPSKRLCQLKCHRPVRGRGPPGPEGLAIGQTPAPASPARPPEPARGRSPAFQRAFNDGRYGQIFEAEYRKLATHPDYRTLFASVPLEPERVHDGYPRMNVAAASGRHAGRGRNRLGAANRP